MKLEAHQLVARAGRRTLLHDVSVTARSGEVLAVLGPNGAGKSTLMSLLAGDRRPDRGSVVLGGQDLQRMASLVRARRRAVLPQESRVAFPFSALDVVLLGRYPHHGGVERCRDRRIAGALLERVGLADKAGRPFTALSGGEQLRAQVARVFAQLTDAEDGGVLLLDEPTASLDMPHAATVLRMAREAAAEGAAVLAVLHDLNLAARFADRLLILKDGRVAGDGTPTELLTAETVASVWEQPCVVLSHPADGGPLVVPMHAATAAAEGLDPSPRPRPLVPSFDEALSA